jgi:L-ascorbate metabolism protein UlaG (beta-lactamase superfamily)
VLLLLLIFNIISSLKQNPTLSETENKIVNLNHNRTLSEIDKVLSSFPPQVSPSITRRLILATLDEVLWDQYGPQRSSIQDWFHKRMTLLLNELNSYDSSMGTKIYHVYNNGNIVKIEGITLCFDLVRRATLKGFAIPDDVMTNITRHCDVLFISHQHIDHYDSFVGKLMATTWGRPVLGPSDISAPFNFTSVVKRSNDLINVKQSLPIQGGNKTIGVYIYPGIQNTSDTDYVLDNIYVVETPKGIRIGNTGDHAEYDPISYPWFKNINQIGVTHILFIQIFANPRSNFISAFADQFFVVDNII